MLYKGAAPVFRTAVQNAIPLWFPYESGMGSLTLLTLYSRSLRSQLVGCKGSLYAFGRAKSVSIDATVQLGVKVPVAPFNAGLICTVR